MCQSVLFHFNGTLFGTLFGTLCSLIVGDRGPGKTSIGLDTILNQKYKKVFCIYVAIGEKASSILDVFLALMGSDGIFYLSVLVACASASALDQLHNAYTAIALSEFFVIVRQLPIFLMLDGLSKHAIASRVFSNLAS